MEKNGLQIRDRVLTVTPQGASWTLAAFAGPGLGAPPTPAVAAALAAAHPDLMLLLGDLGDRPATAKATLAALATVPAPTLLVGGGRDTPARIADAIAALRAGTERIIDATGLREVRLGSDTLIPVAGALDGRYAVEERACGYALEDLKRLAKEVAGGPGRRWLIGWEAPGLGGVSSVSRTDQGVDVGSPALAQLGMRLGAPGGLFAWPHVQAGRPTSTGGNSRLAAGEPAKDFQLVVPRLSGPAVERADGSMLPSGFALLRLDSSGLALAALRELP
ncbi:MAG: hypothetical protein ACHQ53_00635 [Polyangiales bacterium]